MPNPISNQSNFSQIHATFQKNSVFQTNQTLRANSTQLYVSSKTHNIFAGSDKINARQQKYDSAYQAVKSALTKDVGAAAANKILSRVDQQIGNRSLSNGILRSDLNRIQTQLQTLQRDEGKFAIASKDFKKMFSYDTSKGVCENFMLDAARDDYRIGGERFLRNADGAHQGLKKLFSDLPIEGSRKMVAAVSQLTHQGMMAPLETHMAYRLMDQHDCLVADNVPPEKNYTVQRQDNGDVTVTGHYRREFSQASLNNKSPEPIGEGSHYHYSISITLKQDEVLSGNPVAHVDDNHFSYQINP